MYMSIIYYKSLKRNICACCDYLKRVLVNSASRICNVLVLVSCSHLISGTDFFLSAINMHTSGNFGRLLIQCQEHVASFKIETFCVFKTVFELSIRVSYLVNVSCFVLYEKKEIKSRERSIVENTLI